MRSNLIPWDMLRFCKNPWKVTDLDQLAKGKELSRYDYIFFWFKDLHAYNSLHQMVQSAFLEDVLQFRYVAKRRKYREEELPEVCCTFRAIVDECEVSNFIHKVRR